MPQPTRWTEAKQFLTEAVQRVEECNLVKEFLTSHIPQITVGGHRLSESLNQDCALILRATIHELLQQRLNNVESQSKSVLDLVKEVKDTGEQEQKTEPQKRGRTRPAKDTK
jgi:hypothetical protein